MSVTPIQSRYSGCVTIFSPCRFLATLPKTIFWFLRDLFCAIGNVFSTPPKSKIKAEKKPDLKKLEKLPTPSLSPVLSQLSDDRNKTPTPASSPRQVSASPFHEIEEIPLHIPQEAPVIRSQGQLMFQALSDHIHPDISMIFESLFLGLDVIRGWDYNESNGSYRLALSNAVKVWVPKEPHEKTKDGALLSLGREVTGRIDREARTLHFNQGFGLTCEVKILWRWTEVNPVFTKMTYHHSGKVGLTAGMLMTYETEFKSVQKLRGTWGNAQNRR